MKYNRNGPMRFKARWQPAGRDKDTAPFQERMLNYGHRVIAGLGSAGQDPLRIVAYVPDSGDAPGQIERSLPPREVDVGIDEPGENRAVG